MENVMKKISMDSKFLNPEVLVLSSLGYCYFLVRKIPKGKLRVISLLPIFYIFSILPWCFSSIFLRALTSFFITWITSFKLLLFCFDRGPLFTCKTYVDFVVLAVFPAKIKKDSPPPNSSLSLEKVVIKLAALPLFTFYLSKQNCPLKLVLFLYGMSIFSGLYVLLTCGSTLVQAMARYELMPISNQPYLATSLQDFWGRRWNRIGSHILRITVYDPTRDALVGILGVALAKVVAMITTLVVSGIVHELLFYYITCGMRPTWEVTWLFVLQGICMLLEIGWKKWARTMGWTPINPMWSVVLTVGFVTITSCWLLFLPIWRSAQSACDLRNQL